MTRDGRLLVAALAIAASGCGGDGTFDMLAPSTPPPPRFREIQDAILSPRCAFAGCHAAPAPAQGMDLSPGVAHASIVSVPSTELAGFDRVRPFDPAGSYLLLKLEGDAVIVGERMPFGGPYLSDAEIATVRAWILAGAPND